MFTTRPELLGTFGMVSSTHWLASATGMRMLELGGNAFDAGVAAGFVLQVVEPHSNGLGGEVRILAAPADRGLLGALAWVNWTHVLGAATVTRLSVLGGTASDPPLAPVCVFGIVEPHSNGLVVEVPVPAAPANRGVEVVNGQAPAPAAATIER